MSLSLGVKLYGSVFIEDTRFVLTQINEDGSFRLSSGNKDYNISVKEPTIIYPDVECFNSPYGTTQEAVRIIFNAPHHIVILRGKIFWMNKEQTEFEIDA